MLEGGDPVVGLHVVQLTALGIHPLHALAQVEGPGQAGLEDVLHVIADQAVHGHAQRLAHGVGPGSQGVPDLGVGGVAVPGVAVLQGVALVGQVVLDGLLIGAGAGQLIPHGGDVLAVLGLQQVGGDQGVLIAVLIAAPHDGGHGAGGHPGDAPAAAVAVIGNHSGGLQELGLSDGHLGEHLVDVHALLGLLESLVELAVGIVVDLPIIVSHGLELTGLGLTGGLGALHGVAGGRVARVRVRGGRAGEQAENHGQSQHQAQKLLHTYPPTLFYI